MDSALQIYVYTAQNVCEWCLVYTRIYIYRLEAWLSWRAACDIETHTIRVCSYISHISSTPARSLHATVLSIQEYTLHTLL